MATMTQTEIDAEIAKGIDPNAVTLIRDLYAINAAMPATPTPLVVGEIAMLNGKIMVYVMAHTEAENLALLTGLDASIAGA